MSKAIRSVCCGLNPDSHDFPSTCSRVKRHGTGPIRRPTRQHTTLSTQILTSKCRAIAAPVTWWYLARTEALYTPASWTRIPTVSLAATTAKKRMDQIVRIRIGTPRGYTTFSRFFTWHGITHVFDTQQSWINLRMVMWDFFFIFQAFSWMAARKGSFCTTVCGSPRNGNCPHFAVGHMRIFS